MGQLDKVINYSKEIEAILETRYSATGKGLQEKMISVESRIPKDVASNIRKIGFIRNAAVHQLGYEVEDLDAYCEMCDFVIEKLGGRVSIGRSFSDRLQKFGLVTGLVAGLIGFIWGWSKTSIGTGLAIGIFLMFVFVAITSRTALKFYRDTISFVVGFAIFITLIYGAISLFTAFYPASANESKKPATILRK